MKPKQFFFVVLGLLVVVAGGGGAGYYYGYGQMTARSATLATKLAAQQAAEQQIESLGSLQHEYNRDIVPILPSIDEALPHSKKQTEILAQIERITGGLGLPTSDITMPGPGGLPSDVSQTIAAGKVLALPINFSSSGSTSQMQALTQKLENLNRYTNVTLLAIDGTQKGPNHVKYTFSLVAYIKP